MRFIENLFGFERRETPGEVIFFAVFELFVVLGTMYLAWTWAFYTQRISDVVLPLGIAQYIDISFLFEGSRALLNAGLVTVLVLVGAARLWRYAYLAAFLLLHLQYAARYSLGEIPHSANLLGMALLALALAPLAFGDALYRRRFVLGFTYFFIGLGYTLAGVSKLVGTGITWPAGQHLWMWIHEKGIDAMAKSGVLDFNLLQEMALASHPLATAFLAFGLLTELGAFLMWWRRLRTPVLLAVIGLHIGIYLVMNIFFTLSVIELTLLALPWAAWIDRVLPQYQAQQLARRLGGTRPVPTAA